MRVRRGHNGRYYDGLCLIDTMAFLSMPAGQTSQTRGDFIAWVNLYFQADPDQPYQYEGIDVYAARCSVLHTFGAEAELHRRDSDIRKLVYSDGGLHYFNPQISPSLVIIGLASFLNDVMIAMDEFMRTCESDANLRELVQTRLPKVFQMKPFPQNGHAPSPYEN